MSIKWHFRPIHLLILVSSLLVLIWFRRNGMFGVAEEGISFYNPIRSLDIYKSVWIDDGTGYLTPFFLLWIPLFNFSKTLFILVRSARIVQAVIFLFLFISGFTGMYLISLEFFKKRFAAIISSLFYFFNLYTMSQVWKRSLYGSMFTWAYLPLFTYLLFRWSKTGKKLYILILLITSFIYSRAFGDPAYTVSFIVIATAIFVYQIITSKKRSLKIKVLKKFVIFGILFLIIHLWWIYPVISTAKYVLPEHVSLQEHFASLKGVSNHFHTTQILLLRQTFLFGEKTWWFEWYNNPFAKGISLLILSLVVIGWQNLKGKKYWGFLTVLFFVGWFVSKGVNPPFGKVFYHWLFNKIPQTVALRNPYEKFGLVFLIPYSVFFASGVVWLYRKYKGWGRRFLVSGILTLTLFVLAWPIWFGRVFPEYAWVEVPDYFEKANDFINKDAGDFRILMLPMIPGHSARFTWGFRGSDPSMYLFDKTTISKTGDIKYYNDKYQELRNSFINDGENLGKLLDEVNVKYLILRKDLKWEPVGAMMPSQVRDVLKSNQAVEFIEEFGELEIYQYKERNSRRIETIGGRNASFNYMSINPTRYVVDVADVTEPYVLVFKETYNPLWEARIDDRNIEEHIVAYNYANAWKVDKLGNYSIEIVLKVYPWD